MERPAWLPAMAPVDGPPAEVLPRLYRLFLADFEAKPRLFQGLPVRWDRRPVSGQVYEQGFWHLVSRFDQRTKARRFDQRRAERLPWLAALLENAGDPGVLVWEYREAHGRLRTYVWLERWDYVAVLETVATPSDTSIVLVTAYFVDGRATERAFRKKHERHGR